MRYDPREAPDPSRWLATDEAERLEAVLRYHSRGGAGPGSARLHAAFHVTVETQIAEGLGGAVRALGRLIEQGLDRHDAIHCIGTVTAEEVYGALKNRAFDAAHYEARLDALTAEAWRNSGQED